MRPKHNETIFELDRLTVQMQQLMRGIEQAQEEELRGQIFEGVNVLCAALTVLATDATRPAVHDLIRAYNDLSAAIAGKTS